jgi:SAM-dependent methyltransferase
MDLEPSQVQDTTIIDYWDSFYERQVARIPSQFAAMVASELPSQSVIIDVGCGNGRDTFFFADCGHVTVGLDASKTAVDIDLDQLAKQKRERVRFLHFTVGRDKISELLSDGLTREAARLPVILYSRFFLHAITEQVEDRFVEDLSACADRISTGYLEYRELKDAAVNKVYGDHYRRYIDPDAFNDKVARLGKFKLDYQVVAQGLAKFHDEDPWIARQVFSSITPTLRS